MVWLVKLDKSFLRNLTRIQAIALVSIVFLLIAILTQFLLRPGIRPAPDFPCSKTSSMEALIDVSRGESGSSIALDLAAAGVVKSSTAFFRIAVSDPRSSSIAPGIHRISKNLCARDALTQLLDSSRITNLISIREGLWSSEIYGELEKSGFNAAQILSASKEVDLPAGFTSLEGLFFPAQYSFDSSTTVIEVFNSLVSRATSEIKRAGFYDSGSTFTPSQLLTIASLVQAEGDEVDFKKISQVVRNRLTKGMPLQFDSTVHYIKKTRGSVFLSTQSTLVNSPFNTYRRYGLPPTPINNPGAAALYAASHPEPGAWLYFITVAPRDTRFTDSHKEFTNWKLLYKKNLRAGKFGGGG